MEKDEVTQEKIESTILEYRKRIEFKEMIISLCEMEINELKHCIKTMKNEDVQRLILKKVSDISNVLDS